MTDRVGETRGKRSRGDGASSRKGTSSDKRGHSDNSSTGANTSISISDLINEHQTLTDSLQSEVDKILDSHDQAPMRRARIIIDDLLDWGAKYEKVSSAKNINKLLRDILKNQTDVSNFDSDSRKKILQEIEEYYVAKKELDILNDRISKVKDEIRSCLSQESFLEVESFTKEAESLKTEIQTSSAKLDTSLNNIRELIQATDKDSKKAKSSITILDSINEEANTGADLSIGKESKKVGKGTTPKESSEKKEENVNLQSGDGSKEKEIMSPAEVISNLIKTGHIGIAARYAKALEGRGQRSPIPAKCLKLAAASRISFEKIDASTQNFVGIIGDAEQDSIDNAYGSAIVAGSLLRISILQPELSSARTIMSRLGLGSFTAKIGNLVREISNLGYSFKSTLDEIADIADVAAPMRKSRVEEELLEWKRGLDGGPQAVTFRIFVGSHSEFGSILNDIREGQKSVSRNRVLEVVEKFESREFVQMNIKEVRASKGLSSKGYGTRFQAHACRRLKTGADLLRKWLKSCEIEERKSTKDLRAFKKILDRLDTQAGKVVRSLERQQEKCNSMEGAICIWLAGQVREFQELLKGNLENVYSNIDMAIYGGFDLLPFSTDFPELEGEESEVDHELIEFLSTSRVLGIEDSIAFHGENGTFRKAARLLKRVEDPKKQKDLGNKIQSQRQKMLEQVLKCIQKCTISLREVGRFDYKRHVDIKRDIDRLEKMEKDFKWENEISIDELSNLEKSDLSGEVKNIFPLLERIENLVEESRSDIRDNQRQRLEKLRREKPERAVEIDDLIENLNSRKLDRVENQIAHIRDDRVVEPTSRDVAVTGFSGPFDDFFPDFVRRSEEDGWPSGYKQYAEALKNNDLLSVSGDRQAASRKLLKDWFSLEKAVSSSKPTESILKELLRELSFETGESKPRVQVKAHRAWIHDVRLRVPYDPIRTWFVPPVFGSDCSGRYVVAVMHPSVLMEQIRLELKSDTATIVIVSGKLGVERRKEMANHFRQQNVAALILDESLIAFLASRKEERLRVLFDCGLPFGRIDPYITDAGRLPPEMFFGREQEIEKIVSRSAEGILVYGGRQLGKSALLAHVKELQHDKKSKSYVILNNIIDYGSASTKATKIWSTIATGLQEFGVVNPKSVERDQIIDDIQSWFSKYPNGRILCLFDEADRFMAFEAKNNFPNLMHMKSLMENTSRRFKMVFAGLHQVQRMYRLSNSPLAHLGAEICVGPLDRSSEDWDAARRLAEVPMRAAGFSFSNPSAPYDILSYVNHYPSLLQVYGKELISHIHTQKVEMDGPLWIIPDEMLQHEAEGFKRIDNSIRRKFNATLELDVRYRLIAYVLGFLKHIGRESDVMHDGLTPQQIRSETAKHWPKNLDQIPLADMHVVLDEMFELGILGRSRHSHRSTTYCLRTSQVAEMLGAEDQILMGLNELYEVEPPVGYNPGTHRKVHSKAPDLGRVRDASHMSPLTDLQSDNLLTAGDGEIGIKFVVGTQLLGLYGVGKALEDYARTYDIDSNHGRIRVSVPKSIGEYGKIIRARTEGRDQSRFVVVCPSKIPIDEKLIALTESQQAVRNGSVRPIFVLDAVDPVMRQTAIRRNSAELKPWGEEMLRVYLERIELFDSQAFREVVLRKTGGIPDDIVRLLKKIQKSNDDPIAEAERSDDAVVDSITNGDGKFSKVTEILIQMETLYSDDGDSVEHVYEYANEEILKQVGVNLETIGYDLTALGVLDIFEIGGKFRVTHLGKLLANQGR